MGVFDKAKDLYKLQRDAKKIKKELKDIHIEAEVNGVTVTVNGEQEVMEIIIPEEMTNTKKIAETVKEATNKAMKKAQMVAAEKMQAIMGEMGMGLPGMGQT